jgi:hypothetical protein
MTEELWDDPDTLVLRRIKLNSSKYFNVKISKNTAFYHESGVLIFKRRGIFKIPRLFCR